MVLRSAVEPEIGLGNTLSSTSVRAARLRHGKGEKTERRSVRLRRTWTPYVPPCGVLASAEDMYPSRVIDVWIGNN